MSATASTSAGAKGRGIGGSSRRVPPWADRAVIPGFLLLAALLPFFFPSGSGFMGTATLAAAYTVMALGLNIIVGFAGLLDLGFVAFFAIGAYAIGWFGSGFFAFANHEKGVHIGVSGFAANLPGIHLNFLLILVAAVVLTTIAGMLIGLPTLRLRGDYIAIVTLAFGPSSAGCSRTRSGATRRSPPDGRASRRWTRSSCRGCTSSRR